MGIAVTAALSNTDTCSRFSLSELLIRPSRLMMARLTYRVQYAENHVFFTSGVSSGHQTRWRRSHHMLSVLHKKRSCMTPPSFCMFVISFVSLLLSDSDTFREYCYYYYHYYYVRRPNCISAA